LARGLMPACWLVIQRPLVGMDHATAAVSQGCQGSRTVTRGSPVFTRRMCMPEANLPNSPDDSENAAVAESRSAVLTRG